MGTVCAPPYANVFMNKMDRLLRNLAIDISKNGEDPIRLFKRFLDDIFIIWKGTIEELQIFLEKMNLLHPTIKFTAEFTSPYKCDIVGPHNCFCHHTMSIPFLDTRVSKEGGKLITDLYEKPSTAANISSPQVATLPISQKTDY